MSSVDPQSDLADEGAILVCGIYIDLNQIRAGEALTPETSPHTSAHDRIAGRRQRFTAAAQGIAISADQTADGWLCELSLEEGLAANMLKTTASTISRRASDKGILPITLDEYLQLLDASGRIAREGKTGAIPIPGDPWIVFASTIAATYMKIPIINIL